MRATSSWWPWCEIESRSERALFDAISPFLCDHILPLSFSGHLYALYRVSHSSDFQYQCS